MILHNALQELIVDAYKEQIAFDLGMVDTFPALDALAAHLSSEDPDVSRQVVDTLADIGSDYALNMLADHFLAAPLEIPAEDPLKMPDCLSLARLRQVFLNPKLKTPEESQHLSSHCVYCEKAIRFYESDIEHPAVLRLILGKMGRLAPDEAQFVEQHVNLDQCLLCHNRLKAFRVREMLQEFSQMAGQQTEKVVAAIEQRVGRPITAARNALFRLPSSSGAYADTSAPRFSMDFTDATDTLKVSLRENSIQMRGARVGDLVAEVRAAETFAGDTVRIELVGGQTEVMDDQAEARETKLLVWEGECFGDCNFGNMAGISNRLGENVTVIAELIPNAYAG